VNVESWPDAVDEILSGDQSVALAHATPASGVVLTPVTNFALRDRRAGTVSVNSSVGMWRKLQAVQRNPRVALAFHTRAHGFSKRPEYVLVQGEASLPSSLSDPDAWLESLGDNWERFGGEPRAVGPLWERWLRAYHWRVNVDIAVRRVIVWPNLDCRGASEVHGAPLPSAPPASQPPPGRGTGPRVDHVRAARRTRRLADVLLGFIGTDGYPVVAPVKVMGSEDGGILLAAPTSLVPPGGRRAALLGHEFSRHVVGQHQRKHTGWLEAPTQSEGSELEVVYAPHTQSGYRLPPSRLLFNLAAGFISRRGLRAAVREGFLQDPPGR
jgi:hypothetical protein